MDRLDSPTFRTSLPKLGICFHCAFLASPNWSSEQTEISLRKQLCRPGPLLPGPLKGKTIPLLPQRNCNWANYSDFDLGLLFMQNTVRYFMSVQGFLEEQRTFFVRCVIREFRQQVHFILKAFTQVSLAFIGTCLLKWEGAVCSARVGKH